MKVFLSSTITDLQHERRAALEVIDRLWSACAMEKFPASDHHSRDWCLARLRECDAVVLILGELYGSVDRESGLSFTELEYDTATSLGRHTFVFIRNGRDWRSAEQDPERNRKHSSFKNKLDQRLWRPFATTDELKVEIMTAFYEHERSHGSISARISTFQTLEEYYGPFLKKQQLLNHGFPLVGAALHTDHLKGFLSSQKRVAILPGRGGAGKSRLLLESLREVEASDSPLTVRMMRQGMPFEPDCLKELPAGQVMIAVDDAHRVLESLPGLIAVMQQHPERVRLILATRPYGLGLIDRALTDGGLAADEIAKLPEVMELKPDESEALARSVLGAEKSQFVRQLVSVSRGSPLVIVVGGQLIARNSIDPAFLTNDERFRREMENRFYDVFVGQVSVSPELAQKVIPLVAALGPFHHEDKALVGSAAKFLGIEVWQLRTILSELEAASIFVRRGFSLRVTPDVLSDITLRKACMDDSGRPTGYADGIYEVFGQVQLGNVLANLAELDWQVNRGQDSALLKAVWQDLRRRFAEASAAQSKEFLAVMRRVAWFQPGEVLHIIGIALEHQTPDTDGSYEEVLQAVSPVAYAVAHHLEYSAEAAEILWQLRQIDRRDPRQQPDHPLRILADLAAYRPNNPLALNQVILDCVSRWVGKADAADEQVCLIEVLEEFLKKKGTVTSSGIEFKLSGFTVSARGTEALRACALKQLEALACKGSPVVKRRVLASLIGALRNPAGFLGQRVKREEMARWIQADRKVLEAIAGLLPRRSTFLLVAAEAGLTAIAGGHLLEDEIRQLLAHLPKGLEYRCLRHLWLGKATARVMPGSGQLENTATADRHQAVQELVETHQTASEVKIELERLLREIRSHGEQCEEGPVLMALAEKSPLLATELGSLVVADPDSVLLQHLAQLVIPLRSGNQTGFAAIVDAAVHSRHVAVLKAAARVLPWCDNPTELERQNVRDLARHTDRDILSCVILAVRTWPLTEAIDMLLGMDIGVNGLLADEICNALFDQCGPGMAKLDDASVHALLRKLIPVEDLSQGTWLGSFLGVVVSRNPMAIVEFYLKRVEHEGTLAGASQARYQAIHLGSAAVTFPDTRQTRRREALIRVRDALLEPAGKETGSILSLFALLSQGFDDLALQVLGEWVDSGDETRLMGAVSLICASHEDFAFANQDFVVHILDVAQGLGCSTLNKVIGLLHSHTFCRGGSARSGEPIPSFVTLRDNARNASGRYPRGSAANEFYSELQRYAEDLIEHERKRWDEENGS